MSVILQYSLWIDSVLLVIEVVVSYFLYRLFNQYFYTDKFKLIGVGISFHAVSLLLNIISYFFFTSISLNPIISTLDSLGMGFLLFGFYFMIKRLLHFSHIDHLTQTFTKRYIDRLFIEEKNSSGKRDKHFSIIFIDINHFKQVNNQLGHEGANEVLQEIAKTLQKSVRVGDKVGRYGGDEFIILLHHATEIDAELVLNRCRQSILKNDYLQLHNIDVSGGVATYPYDGKTIESLYKTADKRMYEHKKETKGNAI
ncbi:hypothetical protein CVD28_01905 [Bacillus sp. M6-12]|uniref:GGDEF domain-containing protein n=1 Tax=Bacillus sp. M6-12 TaxID=2054166 RepID=UPI000C793022|nr:GGDEF domain-containing protein [Bacillus sp. M6-12]PLS19186.1 hypothetical protein CVD28_01905 [Bacillus sp. M6-12]